MSEASESAAIVPTAVPSVRERRARVEDDRAGWEWCVERVVRMLVCLSGRAKRLRRRRLHWYDEAALLKLQRGSFSRYLRAGAFSSHSTCARCVCALCTPNERSGPVLAAIHCD